MNRRDFLALTPALFFYTAASKKKPGKKKKRLPDDEQLKKGQLWARSPAKTRVSIQDDTFLINDRLTYAGRTYQGVKIEGLLMNCRMDQGIFDDLNFATRSRWRYPDTRKWDPVRNTREFIEAMPEWRRHGLLSFTLGLQGSLGNGIKEALWDNSAFKPGGSLRDDYLKRLEHVLDQADELGMAPILVYFDFGQDQRLRDEEAVRHGVQEITYWLLRKGYRNVLVVINNECEDRQYDHAILKPKRLPELIKQVQSMSMDGRRLWVGSSLTIQNPPPGRVVEVSDFLVLRGNGARGLEEIIEQTRQILEYHPMPLFFSTEGTPGDGELIDRMLGAFRVHASWMAYDPGKSDYNSGFLCPPVNWSINTERKKALFGAIKELTGE